MNATLIPILGLGCLCGPDCNCNAVQGVGQYDFEAGIGEVGQDFGGGLGDVLQTSEGLGSNWAAGAESGGGLFSSIGKFFGSEFGSSFLKAGLTVGGAFAISELTGGGHGRTGGGGGTTPPGGTQTGAGGQPINIQLPAQQPAAGAMPSWFMPAAVLGGLGLLAAVVLSRR